MLHKFKYNVKNSKLLFGGVAKCNKNDFNIKTNAWSYLKFSSMRSKKRLTGNKTFSITCLETTRRSSNSKQPHLLPQVRQRG